MPHELQRMSRPIRRETTGSAIEAPAKATTIPAITTPTADTASPTICMYALRTFKSCFAAFRNQRLITVFMSIAINATAIIGRLCTGSGWRRREMASQKINKAMTTKATALTSAVRIPTR